MNPSLKHKALSIGFHERRRGLGCAVSAVSGAHSLEAERNQAASIGKQGNGAGSVHGYTLSVTDGAGTVTELDLEPTEEETTGSATEPETEVDAQESGNETANTLSTKTETLPSTGDSARIGLWMVLLAAGGMGLCGAAIAGRRRQK